MATAPTNAVIARAPRVAAAAAEEKKAPPSLAEALKKAGKQAIGGGVPGAIAMGLQVCTLMWLRTTMNYQYRYGMSTTEALRALYKEGGVVRFYRGMGPALIQGPLSRFGDTAANAGILSLLESSETTRNLPVGVRTIAASGAAGLFRILLMPVDTLKTIMQVEGKQGVPNLMKKLKMGGPSVLFAGALGAASATFVGHYPWFFTYNFLNEHLPRYDDPVKKLLRNAGIGFCASVTSDTISNSLRVVKTTKQTYATPISYAQAVKVVVDKDGVVGLFGRGLKTRIITNGLQGMLFTVLWRAIHDRFFKDGAQ